MSEASRIKPSVWWRLCAFHYVLRALSSLMCLRYIILWLDVLETQLNGRHRHIQIRFVRQPTWVILPLTHTLHYLIPRILVKCRVDVLKKCPVAILHFKNDLRVDRLESKTSGSQHNVQCTRLSVQSSAWRSQMSRNINLHWQESRRLNLRTIDVDEERGCLHQSHRQWE